MALVGGQRADEVRRADGHAALLLHPAFLVAVLKHRRVGRSTLSIQVAGREVNIQIRHVIGPPKHMEAGAAVRPIPREVGQPRSHGIAFNVAPAARVRAEVLLDRSRVIAALQQHAAGAVAPVMANHSLTVPSDIKPLGETNN